MDPGHRRSFPGKAEGVSVAGSSSAAGPAAAAPAPAAGGKPAPKPKNDDPDIDDEDVRSISRALPWLHSRQCGGHIPASPGGILSSLARHFAAG